MTLSETIKSLIVRLVFSVTIPTTIVVLTLYIFNSVGDVKYLPASAMAFSVGFFAIYLIFKYWIKPASSKSSRYRFRYYVIVFVINLVINIEIVYLLVNHVGVPLLTAQTVAAVAIAYESYYAYLSLLYRKSKKAVIKAPKKLEDEIIYYDDKGERIRV